MSQKGLNQNQFENGNSEHIISDDSNNINNHLESFITTTSIEDATQFAKNETKQLQEANQKMIQEYIEINLQVKNELKSKFKSILQRYREDFTEQEIDDCINNHSTEWRTLTPILQVEQLSSTNESISSAASQSASIDADGS
jgi:ElaB/YqjD/DUF883 family membrane-anchored ribosome-binding protein